MPTQPDGAAAKAGKDRFVTFAQALMIFTVLAAHWSFMVVQPDGQNMVGLDRLFRFPAMSWSLVIVMPCWFSMVGALSKKAALGRVRTYYWRRFKRLLIPYYVFAAVMVTVELALWAAKIGPCGNPAMQSSNALFTFDPAKALSWIVPFPHYDCLGLTQAPFWFLTALLFITLAMPLTARIYRTPRLGTWFPLLLVATTFACDLGQKVLGGQPLLLLVRILSTWVYFAYLGFFYVDRRYEPVRRYLLPGALLTALVTVLAVAGPYPDYLFGSANDGNQFPPTGAYLLGGTAALLLLLWGRESVMRFSELPGVRRTVDYLARNNYTIYIWHMTVLVIVWWGLHWVGLWPAVSSWPTLLYQLLQVVLCIPVLMLLVGVFRRTEQWDVPPRWMRRRTTRPAEAAATA